MGSSGTERVFVSHSFEDKSLFADLVRALESAGIGWWDPGEITAGKLLSEQLRAAIADSYLCVFLATQRSLLSSWCSSELGAFWGAGKPVLLYAPDPSLAEDALPKQFQGHFVERDLSRLVATAKAAAPVSSLSSRVSLRGVDEPTWTYAAPGEEEADWFPVFSTETKSYCNWLFVRAEARTALLDLQVRQTQLVHELIQLLWRESETIHGFNETFHTSTVGGIFCRWWTRYSRGHDGHLVHVVSVGYLPGED
jgi:TIR domain